jgi:selenocysteine lyase/cysteine desulfurase
MNCEVFDYWSTSFYMIENEAHDEIKQKALDYISDSLESEIVVAPRSIGGGLRETNFELFHKSGVSCATRGGGIRLSPHFYNSQAEIDMVAEILSSVAN